jgi:hypothetical protein
LAHAKDGGANHTINHARLRIAWMLVLSRLPNDDGDQKKQDTGKRGRSL